MLGALAAFVYRRHVLSGVLVAVGIVAYWGTMFVWLPLGFLITCLLLRDLIHDPAQSTLLHRAIAACGSRRIFALLLLTALLHDNDAAITELKRIGPDQQNIILETFADIPDAVSRQVDTPLQNWRAYLGVAAVYAVPPALCAALWTGVMRRFGRSLLQPA